MQQPQQNVGNLLDALLAAKPKIKVFRGKDGLFYFRLYDYQGHPMLTGQGTATESECLENLELTRRLVSDARRFRRQTTRDSKFTYMVVHPDGKVLAVGAGYPTVRDCDEAIQTLKHSLTEAVIEA